MQSIATNKVIQFTLIVATLNLVVGCHYYKVATSTTVEEGIAKISDDKHIVIHFEEMIFNLSSINIDKNKEVITGTKGEISAQDLEHSNPKPRNNRYKKNYERPYNDVHIYIDGFIESVNGEITINFDKIQKINIYEKQKGATVGSHIFTGLGITGVIVGILVLIAINNINF